MSTAKPVEWQERQQLSNSEWTHWYSAPTPLPGLPTEGTIVSGIRYEWRALVLESDYLAERKAREAAEAQIAELNSINSKLCEMMDEELENAKAWEAKAEAAEADARRYRWLRVQGHKDIAACWLLPRPYPEPLEITTPEDFDAAIDAATQRG